MSSRHCPPAFRTFLLLALAAPASAQLRWEQRSGGEPIPRYRHALAYDEARAECLLFSGAPSPERDTWTWDGARWAQRFPARSPAPQTGYALAYDSLRGVVVLYGREEFGAQAPETFHWDGTTWSDRSPLLLPSNRDRSAMAFDRARGVCVLFGGHSFFTPMSDTWEWDGTSWSQRTPLTTAPPARAYHGMAFDEARGRIVLFGGFGTAAPLGDTWEWDGSDWVERTPPAGPAPRELGSLAYDSVRQRVVLYGGYVPGTGALGDTWEWDGTSWSQRFPAHHPPPLYEYGLAFDRARGVTVLAGGSTDRGVLTGTWEWDGLDWSERRTDPPARQRHALAHDRSRGVTVLFGGFHDPLYLDDTWEWDGASWIEKQPALPQPAPGAKARLFAGRPEGRIETALAYDPRRRAVVMFGGQGRAGRALDDTWEWDGTVWAERLAPVRPPGRHGHALACDEARGRIVVFGGRASFYGSSLADTWEWDGQRWEQRFPATVPPAREDLAMTWDAARGRVLLFAGESCPPFSSCTPLGDTWEWDGDDWTLVASAGPPHRAYHALAYDRNRSRAILYGGLTFLGSRDDEWEWDGAAWRQRSPLDGPAARNSHALAFDERRGRTVLFGGADDGSKVSSDTWELFAPCDVAGPGHPGGGLAISCTGEPRLGASFCIAFDDPAGTGAHLLTVAPGPCRSPPTPSSSAALCASGFVYLQPTFLFQGSGLPALHCGSVPPSPALAGAAFCAQGLAQEAGCWRLTDGLSLLVQP